VEFGRDGNPKRGYIVGQLKANDHRFIANEGDENTLTELGSTSREPIGRSGWVSHCGGRNLFRFEVGGKL
jgi:hypothetical protein